MRSERKRKWIQRHVRTKAIKKARHKKLMARWERRMWREEKE